MVLFPVIFNNIVAAGRMGRRLKQTCSLTLWKEQNSEKYKKPYFKKVLGNTSLGNQMFQCFDLQIGTSGCGNYIKEFLL